MNYGAVRIILEKAISSPAELNLPELDEAIRWVEDRGTDQKVYSSQFEAAAVEMRLARRRLANGEFKQAAEAAQRVLTLIGS